MGGTQNWRDIVSQKRVIRDHLLAPYLVDDIDQRLPQVHNVEERSQIRTDPIVQKITDIDNVAVLLEHIEKGEFGAEEVTRAYIKRYVCSYCESRSRTDNIIDLSWRISLYGLFTFIPTHSLIEIDRQSNRSPIRRRPRTSPQTRRRVQRIWKAPRPAARHSNHVERSIQCQRR